MASPSSRRARPALRPRHARRASRERGRPGPRPKTQEALATDAAIFQAAAAAFSAKGFDGIGVDEIAAGAGVNKAMIYYHFADKLELYREVVRDMLRATAARVTEVASSPDPAPVRLDRFIVAFVEMADSRPWFPTLMLREMAEGAPRLDANTLAFIRSIFMAFGRILSDGQAAGLFRPVNPILAYLTTIGPLLLNAARERAARQPGRSQLPMFVDVSHADLAAHMQQVARRMLARSLERTKP